MRRVTFVGFHKNAELAESKLRRLIREHKAVDGFIVSRRNDAGKFSRRGRHFTFELVLKSKRRRKPPAPRKLFRLSIGITYPNKGTYLSYMLQHWQKTTRFPDARKEELTELTIRGLEKDLGYDRSKLWFDLEKSIGIEEPSEVTPRPGLAGLYELTTENPDGEATGTFSTLKELSAFVEEEE